MKRPAPPRPDARKTRQRHRRLRLTVLLLIAAAAVTAIVVADRSGVFGRRAIPDDARYDGQTAVAVHVVDGDTLDIDIPDGDRPRTRIRLWGIDTPEIAQDDRPAAHFGPEAAALARQLVKGKPVRIQLEPQGRTRGTYHRLLAWVYLEDGRMLNALLVERGMAYADPRFPNSRSRELWRLQTAARKDRRGLWKTARAADVPKHVRRKLRPPMD